MTRHSQSFMSSWLDAYSCVWKHIFRGDLGIVVGPVPLLWETWKPGMADAKMWFRHCVRMKLQLGWSYAFSNYGHRHICFILIWMMGVFHYAHGQCKDVILSLYRTKLESAGLWIQVHGLYWIGLFVMLWTEPWWLIQLIDKTSSKTKHPLWIPHQSRNYSIFNFASPKPNHFNSSTSSIPKSKHCSFRIGLGFKWGWYLYIWS